MKHRKRRQIRRRLDDGTQADRHQFLVTTKKDLENDITNLDAEEHALREDYHEAAEAWSGKPPRHDIVPHVDTHRQHLSVIYKVAGVVVLLAECFVAVGLGLLTFNLPSYIAAAVGLIFSAVIAQIAKTILVAREDDQHPKASHLATRRFAWMVGAIAVGTIGVIYVLRGMPFVAWVLAPLVALFGLSLPTLAGAFFAMADQVGRINCSIVPRYNKIVQERRDTVMLLDEVEHQMRTLKQSQPSIVDPVNVPVLASSERKIEPSVISQVTKIGKLTESDGRQSESTDGPDPVDVEPSNGSPMAKRRIGSIAIPTTFGLMLSAWSILGGGAEANAQYQPEVTPLVYTDIDFYHKATDSLRCFDRLIVAPDNSGSPLRPELLRVLGCISRGMVGILDACRGSVREVTFIPWATARDVWSGTDTRTMLPAPLAPDTTISAPKGELVIFKINAEDETADKLSMLATRVAEARSQYLEALQSNLAPIRQDIDSFDGLSVAEESCVMGRVCRASLETTTITFIITDGDSECDGEDDTFGPGCHTGVDGLPVVILVPRETDGTGTPRLLLERAERIVRSFPRSVIVPSVRIGDSWAWLSDVLNDSDKR